MLAKEAGIKYFVYIKKNDLAKMLGIDLGPKVKRIRSCAVWVTNVDGTIKIFPSMIQAAKALGVFPAQIYKLAEKMRCNLYNK